MKGFGVLFIIVSLLGVITITMTLNLPSPKKSDTDIKSNGSIQRNRQLTTGMTEEPNIGFAAPHFKLKDLNGTVYSLEQVKGKPVVLNFWASWCTPCKMEAPILARLYGKYNEQVEIYAINLTNSDSIKRAKAFTDKYQFTFPVLLDREGEVANLYQVQAIPTTFFVNKDGIIEEKFIGLASPKMLMDGFEKLTSVRPND